MPVLAAIPLHIHGYNLDYSSKDGDRTTALDAFVFAIVKAFSLIVWFFLSNYFIKQRKVTVVNKVIKWFYGVILVWTAFYAAQVFYSWRYLRMLFNHVQSNAPANITEHEKDED